MPFNDNLISKVELDSLLTKVDYNEPRSYEFMNSTYNSMSTSLLELSESINWSYVTYTSV